MRRWLPGLVILGAYLFSAAVYARLPERIPTHWGIDGTPDGWSSRPVGAFLLPTLGLVIWALLVGLPKIDPRRANYAKFRGTYDTVVLSVVAVMMVLHVAVLGVSLGWPISVARVVPVVVGGLLVLVGNALPRARPNWFFGIRTPWTLSSDRVWERTHRVGGYLMVASGIFVAASALLAPRASFVVLMVSVVGTTLALLAYSYLLWRRESP